MKQMQNLMSKSEKKTLKNMKPTSGKDNQSDQKETNIGQIYAKVNKGRRNKHNYWPIFRKIIGGDKERHKNT